MTKENTNIPNTAANGTANVANIANNAPTPVPQRQPQRYTPVAKGYPVQPGQTWHDLTAEQRREYFNAHENRWKIKFAQQQANGASMNWTRG